MTRGFSLIEVLVALLVLSVGMLGTAGLLLGALRDQARALRHGAATLLVADMASRIRANPAGRDLYGSRDGHASALICDESLPCDTESLAAHDLAYFDSAANALLPHRQPRAHVTFEPATGSTTPDRYFVSLTWSDTADPRVSDEATLILLMQPVAGAP
jgi:type IV pilus modification protein PilV